MCCSLVSKSAFRKAYFKTQQQQCRPYSLLSWWRLLMIIVHASCEGTGIVPVLKLLGGEGSRGPHILRSGTYLTSLLILFFLLWATSLKSLLLNRMTSFHTEKCYHLVTAHAASALCICSSIWQFPIHSAFILVVIFSCLYHEVEVINMVYCGDCRLIYIRDVHALNYFCLSDAICVKDTGSVSGTARETHGRERNIANILASCSGYEAHSSA